MTICGVVGPGRAGDSSPRQLTTSRQPLARTHRSSVPRLVWFRFHDAGEPTLDAVDLLEFVAPPWTQFIAGQPAASAAGRVPAGGPSGGRRSIGQVGERNMA